jgi:hypothetical protein
MLHEIKNLENFQAPQTAGLRFNSLPHDRAKPDTVRVVLIEE